MSAVGGLKVGVAAIEQGKVVFYAVNSFIKLYCFSASLFHC